MAKTKKVHAKKVRTNKGISPRAMSLISALTFILVGVLFIIFKGQALQWIITIIGALFLVLGILEMLGGFYVLGIIEAVAGVVIIIGGWAITAIFILVLGIALIIKGILDLINELKYKNHRFFDILMPVVTIVVGALFIVSKWAVVDWFMIILGAFFAVDGLVTLFTLIKRR